MQGSVGLKVMNSSNPELNWKTVTKGRRSRKSTARSFNANSKAGDSISPKRVGDFSGSDSDKVSEAICGQSSSSKSENIPIKKRRHLLETPLRGQGSTSSQIQRPVSEDHGQFFSPSCSSGKKMSNWQESAAASAKVGFNKGFDHILLCEQVDRGYNDAEDFSGIALLAAAASMDEDNDYDKKEDLIALEDTSAPKESDGSSSALQSELGLKSNKSENSSSNVLVNEGSADGSIATNSSAVVSNSSCRSSVDVAVVPKVNRQHWDLNTPMDAWDEPYDDSLAGNTSKDDDGIHIDSALSNTVGTGDELSDLKIEEHNCATAFLDPDPSNASSSKNDMEASHGATEKGLAGGNSRRTLSCDDQKQILNQVPKTDAPISSDRMTSKEINNTVLNNVAVIKKEDCSSNSSEPKTAAVSERIQTVGQDISVHYMAAAGVSESPLNVEFKDMKDTWESREYPGTCIQDALALVTTDLRIGNDGTLVPDSTNPDCQGPQLAEPVVKHEDNSFPNEGLKGIAIEDSCKSSSAGLQCDDPSSSVGRIGTFDTRCDSHLSQDNRFDAIDGDGLTRFEEGYDSPYEDGELRGSFSYSWEDNELENECVDYESDGRNGDDRNAAGYPGPENVDDGSEGSHGTQRGHSSVKRLPAGSESKTGPVRHLSRYFAKDDSDNNERAGKGSNAGSGTTVEQSMEMNADENVDIMKRRQLTGRPEVDDIKIFNIEGYASKMARGKLHSRIEGRSFDVSDGKDAFYPQPFRSHRPSSFAYSRHEREMSPDKQFVRYRPATHVEREGDRYLSTNWGSRRQYTSNYQAPDGGRMYTRLRNFTGDLDKIGEMDVHDPRQTANYMSKGPNRPLMRSPPERDDYFGVRKRMPLSRGGASHRSRGHYPQRGAGRDFRENLEPIPDDTGAPPIRFPRYISRRDRSFSPGSGRGAGQMPFSGRKSRSRSRTRSPGTWRRERIMNSRRPSRSPDFRPDARMRNMAFPKPGFTSDYGEEYMPPSRACFSPQRNRPRWVEDHAFTDNNVRRRRSPVRMFKRTPQRFDSVGSSGRMKSDEYFRPMARPGRFSFKPNGNGNGNGGRGFRDFKFESNRTQLHSADGSNGTNKRNRFCHNGAPGDDFETNNLMKDEAQVTAAPQTQLDREDKQRSFKI